MGSLTVVHQRRIPSWPRYTVEPGISATSWNWTSGSHELERASSRWR